MKKKFNIWLNIITICFCVCAIAVGVYSATTASITASGKIGFTAHGCKVEVGGNIYGHGVKDGADDQDGLPVPSNTPVPFTSKTLDGTIANGVSGDFNIGNRYFSDMESTTGAPAPIVITIKVTNKSNYDVEVATNLNNVTKPTQVSVALTTGNATQTIAKDAVATFVFTLTLNPDSTGTTANYSSFDLTNLVIPMTAVKYETPEGYTITLAYGKNTSKAYPYARFYYSVNGGDFVNFSADTTTLTDVYSIKFANDENIGGIFELRVYIGTSTSGQQIYQWFDGSYQVSEAFSITSNTQLYIYFYDVALDWEGQ